MLLVVATANTVTGSPPGISDHRNILWKSSQKRSEAMLNASYFWQKLRRIVPEEIRSRSLMHLVVVTAYTVTGSPPGISDHRNILWKPSHKRSEAMLNASYFWQMRRRKVPDGFRSRSLKHLVVVTAYTVTGSPPGTSDHRNFLWKSSHKRSEAMLNASYF